MQTSCELMKWEAETDEAYFIRCSKKLANERYVSHYLDSHIRNKSVEPTNTDVNYLDLVDIYEIGVGD